MLEAFDGGDNVSGLVEDGLELHSRRQTEHLGQQLFDPVQHRNGVRSHLTQHRYINRGLTIYQHLVVLNLGGQFDLAYVVDSTGAWPRPILIGTLLMSFAFAIMLLE